MATTRPTVELLDFRIQRCADQALVSRQQIVRLKLLLGLAPLTLYEDVVSRLVGVGQRLHRAVKVGTSHSFASAMLPTPSECP